MDLVQKQAIAATARTLIHQLEFCDDAEFVDLVIGCVASADDWPISPEELR